MSLTPKQQRFVAEYLIDLNASQAAIRAGYSPKTARQQGERLLSHADIDAAVSEAQAARAARTGVTQDRVVQELARLGFSDLRGVFRDGRLLPPEEWPDEVARAISAIKVTTRNVGEGEVEHVAEVKLWSKTEALVTLARHLGMLVDRQQVSGPGGGPLVICTGVPRPDGND